MKCFWNKSFGNTITFYLPKLFLKRRWLFSPLNLEQRVHSIPLNTLNHWALNLKILSFHDLSLRAPLFDRAANGWPKQFWETNHGGRQFSKLWREGSMYLYVSTLCSMCTFFVSPTSPAFTHWSKKIFLASFR